MNEQNIYYSTRQTARILGLSVGTVQRMVSAGALEAYTTEGGHRRILATSVRHYCQARGVPSTGLSLGGDQVCIVHGEGLPESTQQALAHMPHLVLVSHPLELTGLNEDCAAFLIDARLRWLDWSDPHRPLGLGSRARFIVYNSQALPAAQCAGLLPYAQLYPGDISPDLITGFLLGIGADTNPASKATSVAH